MSKIIGVSNISKFIGVSRFKLFNNLFGSSGELDGYTKLLLKMNGTNGSTVFTDECGKVVTAYGNAKISTEQYKFNGSSGYFDRVTAYATVPYDNDLNLSSADFTVDLWSYPTIAEIGIMASSGSAWGWRPFDISFTTKTFRVMAGNGDGWQVDLIGSSVALNNWHHVAFVRNGTTYSLYINGVLAATQVWTGTLMPNSSQFDIGGHPAYSSVYYGGYINYLRVTKGIARWTTNFTPPTTDADYYI